MTCRHRAGDPDCSSSAAYERRKIAERTPDASNYLVVDSSRVEEHLVLKIKYPNCSKCEYEGQKIMVFLNVKEGDALKWRKIDPHFRNPTLKPLESEAPSPDARFPGSASGWADAINYARRKAGLD